MDENSGALGASWFLAEDLMRMPAEAAVVGSLDRLEDSFPRWHTHVAGKLVQTVGRGAQFSTTWTSAQGCWRVLAGRLLDPPRAHDKLEAHALVTSAA